MNGMKLIGITGGVGAGKSQILDYVKENCFERFSWSNK